MPRCSAAPGLARPIGRWPPRPRFRARKGGAGLATLIFLGAGFATPTAAQISGSVAVQNDYRIRGYTISGDRPAAILNLSYDHPSGAYVNISAIGALDRGDDPVLLGAIGNIGYAQRLGAGLSVDAGYVRTQYMNYVGTTGGNASYDELYAGLSAHGLYAHVYVSPDYFRHDISTVYGEIDGAFRIAESWRLTGHVGMLSYLSQPRGFSFRDQYDWRVGIALPIRRFDLNVALIGGGPGRDYYRNRAHGKTAIVASVSWSF